MAFTVLSSSSTGFTLAANGDTLVVPSFGLIYNSSGGGVGVSGLVYGTVVNYGDIIGNSTGISIGAAGNSTITIGANGHVTASAYGIFLNGPANIDNAGEIAGSYGILVNTSMTDVTFTNSGIVRALNSSYNGYTGIDTVINSGRMVGDINLYNGNDFYDGRGGTVVGLVNGGVGNDILVGGSSGDKLFDELGGNWIVGGDGDDEVTIGNFGAANGSATAWGGDANFSSDNSLNDTVIVNGSAANIFLSGKVSSVSTGAVAAWIWGFENATGTNLADSIIGTAGNNIIKGNGGADWLVGNGGFDQFVFASTASTGSTISGFSADLIDLHNIDANTADATDQAFAFKTVHTSNAAGELVFTNFGGGGQIELYTNADNIVDATIFISYAAGSSAPTASDFWL